MTELEQLKLLCEETDDSELCLVADCDGGCAGCNGKVGIDTRLYTDAQLMQQLALCGGNVKKTAHRVLLLKARASDITLPNGLRLPDQCDYYKRLAGLCRQTQSGQLPRADDPRRATDD